MQRSEELDLREGYIYDPIVKGADATFWKNVTGTLTIASSLMRLNADRVASYLQHKYGRLDMKVTIPNTPSGTESKIWGFRNPANPTAGSAYFEIAATVFKVVSYDNFGTAQSTTITWATPTWEANAIEYSINWERDQITFLIAGVVYAVHSTRVGSLFQAVDLANADADNTDITYVQFSKTNVI